MHRLKMQCYASTMDHQWNEGADWNTSQVGLIAFGYKDDLRLHL